MRNAKRPRIPLLFLWTPSLLTIAGCKVGDDGGESAPPSRPRRHIDLTVALCDGGSRCEEVDQRNTAMFLEDRVGLADCMADQTAALFGAWSVGDAASRPFDWEAMVRWGGVFPSIGHVAVNRGCVEEFPQVHSPMVGLTTDPPGFAWAKPGGDDVFIPFQGKATVDGEFHATAVLEDPDADAPALVTVSIAVRDQPPTVHGGLRRGDTFPWGAYRGAITRVVAPQRGVLGAIWMGRDSLVRCGARARALRRPALALIDGAEGIAARRTSPAEGHELRPAPWAMGATPHSPPRRSPERKRP